MIKDKEEGIQKKKGKKGIKPTLPYMQLIIDALKIYLTAEIVEFAEKKYAARFTNFRGKIFYLFEWDNQLYIVYLDPSLADMPKPISSPEELVHHLTGQVDGVPFENYVWSTQDIWEHKTIGSIIQYGG